jgi:hypothetical protein
MLVDHEMRALTGWSMSAEVAHRLAELVAFEARDTVYDSVAQQAAAAVAGGHTKARSKAELKAEKRAPAGLPALHLAISEGARGGGPCPTLTRSRVKHLFGLTRRGVRGRATASDLFASLLARGLASWELAAVIVPTIPSVVQQEAFLESLESELGQCTFPNVYNAVALRALVGHHPSDASRWLAVARERVGDGHAPDRCTVQYESWAADPAAHSGDISKAYQEFATGVWVGGNGDGYQAAWDTFRAFPPNTVDTVVLGTALQGCTTAAGQAELLTEFPDAVDIHCFNRVLNRCVAECDNETATAVISLLSAADVKPTKSTEWALRRCIASEHMPGDTSGVPDSRCEHLEALFRWGEAGAFVVPELARQLIHHGVFEHAHLEIVLHDAAGVDDELYDAAVVAGRAIKLLPDSDLSKPQLFLRGLYSVSTLVLFASIPPALFML